MTNLTIFILFIPILVIILLSLNALFSVVKPDAEKTSAFECGIQAISGQARAPFAISYYLVGILFIIFDVEIVLIYPIAVSLNQVNQFGYWMAIIFFFVLTIGFIVELAAGVLNFTDSRSNINNLW